LISYFKLNRAKQKMFTRPEHLVV